MTSLFPGQECPEPYNELLEINQYLTVQEKNHILFFKEKKIDSTDTIQVFREWDGCCQENKKMHEYDGLSRYSCFFSNMGLNASYHEFRRMYFGREILKKELPVVNDDSTTDGNKISYRWYGDRKLNLHVTTENEKGSFLFSQQPLGTKLEIEETTQY